jgi:hypothetical protein
VRRHTQSDNLVFLAVLIEINRVVALITVLDKQPMATNSALLCVLVKVL